MLSVNLSSAAAYGCQDKGEVKSLVPNHLKPFFFIFEMEAIRVPGF